MALIPAPKNGVWGLRPQRARHQSAAGPTHCGEGAEPLALPSRATLIAAASAGNALEFFDFTVYGYFATQIAAAFFPGGQLTSLLLTWGTYGTAFLARPLGAIIIGSYADRHGRRAAMTLSILLMTIGTAMMAVMPRHTAIGLAAPLGILAARLLQGFSAGGEFGGATAFMLEHGGSRGGLIASFQFISQSVSSLAGSLVAYLTARILSAHALHEWGFRVPFVIGLLICPVGLYLRRAVHETTVFEATEKTTSPALDVLRAHWGRILLAAGTIAGGTAGTYLVIYLPSYAQHDLHMSAADSLAVPVLGALAAVLVTPLSAHWSDRVGRLFPGLVFCPLLMLAAYPAFWAVSARPVFGVLAGTTLVLVVLRSAYSAPLPALLGEMFPPALRGVGMSISYAMGVLVFGSLAPFINTWVIGRTGNKSFPGIYLGVCAAITVLCLAGIQRFVPCDETNLPARKPRR
jgi:MHS family proline/betaine transporter-like MFS transporter